MLDGAGNTDGDIQLWCHHFAGLAHLAVIGRIIRVHRRAGSTNGRAEFVGQRLQQFVELFHAAQSPTAGNHHSGLRQLGAVGFHQLAADETAQALSRSGLYPHHFGLTTASGGFSKSGDAESEHQFIGIAGNGGKGIAGINRAHKSFAVYDFG